MTLEGPRSVLDSTHDPALTSWIASASDPTGDFPIQNLPLGCFRPQPGAPTRIGIAIGELVLDLGGCVADGALDAVPAPLRGACAAPNLNPLMALGRRHWRELRRWASLGFSDRRHRPALEPRLLPLTQVELVVPAAIGDYTDFYASLHHATNVGRLFRPDAPLLPNYKHIPIGYHGRASSVVSSGTPVRRPCGQRKGPSETAPSFGPTRLLDYELEVGFFVGDAENALGTRVPIAIAEERIFGLCLVNDWSARDLQAWEYQPLGPFLSKSFATSVSPWVVTLEALAPFRCPAPPRDVDDPEPLEYLRQQGEAAVDVRVEALLLTERMRELGDPPHRLGAASFAEMYWTVGQMVAHHASNGCNLRPGDLIASGTVSGPGPGSLGCLLEITQRGERPLALPSGEERRMLEDGDEVILRAFCAREGFARIGFGECRGRILAAFD